ncbi:MAG: hypothetical protein JNM88_15810 [Chitinophagaceae bacterium]|nr:hypothetical protein [Chitinophagaceae bacterium]
MKAKKTSKKQKPASIPPGKPSGAEKLPLLKEDAVIYEAKSRYSALEKKELLAERDALISGATKGYTLEEARKLFRKKRDTGAV